MFLLFPPVGFEGNSSLYWKYVVFFPRELKQMEGFLSLFVEGNNLRVQVTTFSHLGMAPKMDCSIGFPLKPPQKGFLKSTSPFVNTPAEP